MAAFRKDTPPPRPAGVLASAARFSFGGSQTWQQLPLGDRRWQIEAWAHFDMCGELRYATGWKGNACAQATLYAADVDPFTGKPTGATDNRTVQTITDSILGGPVKRPQHVRTMCVNLDMVGEVYVIVVAARKAGDLDEWLVVSATEMRQQGKTVEYTRPDTGAVVQLGEQDLMIRIWMPHPRLQLNADSAVRALLPTLREVEKSSQNIAARLDSRLAGAGLLVGPSEVDFPDADDDPSEPGGLLGMFQKSMSASLSDPGSAAAQVPIIVQVPNEYADAFRLITFETPLSKEVIDLRRDAIERLAAGLDLPREILEGMGKSNHWSAWQVEESTYKTHLLPLLDLISDALTSAYLTPSLIAKHVPTPEQYMLAFDGSALIGQPDPLAQTLELRDRGLITDDATRKILSVPDEYAPAGDERLRALATQLVTAAPTLFADPLLRRALGFEAAAAPAVPAAPVAGAPAAPASSAEAAPADGPPSRTASITPGMINVASLSVTMALERAGNRLLNTQRLKAEFSAVPRHELHVRLRPDDGRHGDLLEGAWRHIPEIAAQLRLDDYTRRLLQTGVAHDDELLARWVISLER